MVYGRMDSEEDMRQWVMEILSRAKNGTDLPFQLFILAWGVLRRNALYEYHAKDADLKWADMVRTEFQRTRSIRNANIYY